MENIFFTILICILFIALGLILPALPVIYFGKKLIVDIVIMKKGEKYIGTCTGHKKGTRAEYGSLIVNWTDNKNQKHQKHFHALRIRFGYPYSIKVYSIDNYYHATNLGMLSVLRNTLYFALFAFIWVICIIGTIYTLYEIFTL